MIYLEHFFVVVGDKKNKKKIMLMCLFCHVVANATANMIKSPTDFIEQLF